ncbi:unnamed protein product [Adineta steineri]|uniref:F-box domain-containing protein n=2 Tax=Adineta steineri TaxID=433720 RepID=A0A819ZBR7_9BILA|nr:unnamed protein product [Adineta steineri]
MARNKEKQKNELNRLYLLKSNPPKPKRPHLSQIHTVDELRRWLPIIEQEIHMTLAQTTSVRYTDEKVESMYKQISELENEHKNFRRKIGQLEFGSNVNILVKTIPVEKQIDFYSKKSTNQTESLDDFFNKKPDLPLLSMNEYEPVTVPVFDTNKSFPNKSLMSLKFRKKRKKEQREEIIEQDGLIFQLPEETLLYLFKNFSTEELILVAGVCQLFRRIAYDDTLWKTIDLSTKSYSNQVLVKFFRRFNRPCTEILKISGAPNVKKLKNNLIKLSPYTEQLSYFVRTSYPNLRYLYISKYDFRDNPIACKNITYLPTNLQGLYLTKCEMLMTSIQGTADFLKIPQCTLKNATTNFSLQQLEIFSFEQSSCLGLVSVRYLADLCPNLVELNLNGCFRITRTRTFTDTLLSFHKTIRRLYLKETQVDDDTIHCICRKLKLLNILDIRLCKYVTKNIVENLLTLKQLKQLLADDSIQNDYENKKIK